MEIETNEKAIVITGGPGMGKTSIIKQLAQMGYPSMAVTDYTNTLNQKQYTFFDRGLPDVIGYLALNKLPIPEYMWSAAEMYRYHQLVFITPPWKDIYINDGERKQSFDEAKSTYEAMVKVYADLNYSLVEIPKESIEKRTAFIISKVITNVA